MPTHWGATLGLVVGGIMTAGKVIHAWRTPGWDVVDTFQSCFTGYSMAHEDWKLSRMVFTVPVVTGGVATYVAVKTGYNSWTPTKVNV